MLPTHFSFNLVLQILIGYSNVLRNVYLGIFVNIDFEFFLIIDSPRASYFPFQTRL